MLFASMNAVLDELGVRDPEERKRVRALWRAMNDEEGRIRREKREAALEAAREKAEGRSVGPRRRRQSGEAEEED